MEAIEGCLFIADALTPNNDGKNDDWIVGGLEDFPQSVVVNRWGQRVFETQGLPLGCSTASVCLWPITTTPLS